MATEKYAAFTDRGTLLSTEMNAIADGSYSAAGTALDNATNLDLMAVAQLDVDFVLAPNAYGVVELYMLKAIDGTNYEDGSASIIPSPGALVGLFTVAATTAAQRLMTPPFDLVPCPVKFMIRNSTGQAFPATGTTVKVRTFNRTIN